MTIRADLLNKLIHVRISTLNITIHFLSFLWIRSFGVDILSKAYSTQNVRTVSNLYID